MTGAADRGEPRRGPNTRADQGTPRAQAAATIAITSSHEHRAPAVAAPSTNQGLDESRSQSPVPDGGDGPTADGASTHPATSGTTAGASASSSITGITTASTLLSATASIDHGSFDYRAQLDLPVTAKEPITVLDVTVRVAKCDGLTPTGSWDTGATGQFAETTTTNSDGSITYEFKLNQDQKVNPGTVTFAVQFNHASSGWNAAADTYYVSARTTPAASDSSVNGAY